MWVNIFSFLPCLKALVFSLQGLANRDEPRLMVLLSLSFSLLFSLFLFYSLLSFLFSFLPFDSLLFSPFSLCLLISPYLFSVLFSLLLSLVFSFLYSVSYIISEASMNCNPASCPACLQFDLGPANVDSPSADQHWKVVYHCGDRVYFIFG